MRIYQALEKCYGERRTPRFAILAEKLSRPTAPSVIRKPLPPPPDFSTDRVPMPGDPMPERRGGPEDARRRRRPWAFRICRRSAGAASPRRPPRRRTRELESIPWEELPGAAPEPGDRRTALRGRAASSAPPAPQPAPPVPWRKVASAARDRVRLSPAAGMPTAADFGELLAARDRDGIFDAALRALRRRFARSAVFAARSDGVLRMERRRASASTSRALRRARDPVDRALGLPECQMGQAFYLGPLPPLPRHDALAAALGGWPAECVVQPVRMRDKTVAFLYAECAGAQGATPADLTYLRELAGAAAAALAASIRLKKKQVI